MLLKIPIRVPVRKTIWFFFCPTGKTARVVCLLIVKSNLVTLKSIVMKKVLLPFIVLAFAVPSFSQTIWIANNAPGAVGGTNVFTGSNAINLAIAAAANGDIIYVVPSGVTYSTVNINKGITIFGGGFNPDKPGALRSTVAGFSFAAGASNVRLSGLVITAQTAFSPAVPFSNIMIDKCRMRDVNVNGAVVGNVIIEKCIVGENLPGIPLGGFGSAGTNVRISNNIIYNSNNSGTQGAIHSLNAGLIENNIFVGSAVGGALPSFNAVTNCDIRNNIFLGTRPQGIGTFTGNTQQNNLSFGASDNTFSTINGNTSISNIQGSDPLFVNLPYGATHFFTYNAAFQTGSPAIGSGVSGINMGIYGGTHPFDNFGTSLPIVQAITPPGTVYQGTNMNVRVQAKGN
jgi:hypothetical protein